MLFIWNQLRGVDSNGDPYSLFPQLDAVFVNSQEKITQKKAPFMLTSEKANLNEGILKVTLYFQGFYGEPPLELEINLADISATKAQTITMIYDPIETGKWIEIKYT